MNEHRRRYKANSYTTADFRQKFGCVKFGFVCSPVPPLENDCSLRSQLSGMRKLLLAERTLFFSLAEVEPRVLKDILIRRFI